MPEYESGDTVLMAITDDVEPGTYCYARRVRLPLGIASDIKLLPLDVKPLCRGLRRLGSAVRDERGSLNDAEAVELCDSESRFERCLGISTLAIDATKDDLDRLCKQYTRPFTAPSDALWLDECLMRIVPHKIRPTIETRHLLLMKFVERSSRHGE
jgi:hypothetical protein